MAPEIFESKPYSIKADVYSFGVNLKMYVILIDSIMGNMFKRNSL